MVSVKSFLLAILLAAPVFSLDSNKTLTQQAHRIWGQEEGLFQPTVYSIAQTRDGFLWLGTQDSLIRFDGLHFREYDNAVEAGIKRSLIRSLLEDAKGNLWVGSIGSGLVRISPDGSYKTFSKRDGFDAANVFCLHAGSGKAVWACTDKGLARFEDGKFQQLTTANGLPTNGIHDVCEASDGSIWVAGLDFGIAIGRRGRFQAVALPDLSPREMISALSCTADGTLWAGTSNGLIKIAAGQLRRFTKNDGLPDNAVSSLHRSKDGSLWIGTNDGVSRYRDGQFTVYRVRDGLSHSLVLSLYTDREGSLWAGTKNGLDQFTDSKVTPYTTNEGLISNNVGPVAEDSNGRLWMGTLGQGLNFFDGRRFGALTASQGLPDQTVLSLLPGANGDMWAGTSHGMIRLHSGHVVESYGRAQGLPGDAVLSLFRDPDGVLWAGTNAGLAQLQQGSFKPMNADALTNRRAVYALSATPSVRLFASFEGPHFAYLDHDSSRVLDLGTLTPVDCFYFDTDRAGWFGTLGSGLLYWKNGALSHVRIKDGLYDNRIYAILRDDNRNFWFASSKGIFRVAEQELLDFVSGKIRYVNSIPFSTGQLRFECRSGVQPAACRTRDGRMWFSTTNGLVEVDPRKLTNNTLPPPVQITSMIINGQRMTPRQDLELNPLERNLEIRYAGLSFVAPEKVAFRYRLDGYDKAWVDAGTRREIFYANLPPGQFRFQVEAKNADGIWSREPAVLRFRVLPGIYQHPWFFPALILLVGAGAMGWYRLRIRRLQEGFNLVSAERSRIARELHDTLLQGLSGVTMQLQALWTRLAPSKERDSLSEIIQDAARCSAEARQSLWGLRFAHRRAEEFSQKLADSCREANTGECLELELQLDPVSLASMPEAEFQLLRIAREAVSNAVQHSGGTKLHVSLSATRKILYLTFSDDGRGFDPAAAHTGHFGLIGMRERAKEIDANLQIESAPSKGVRINVQLSLAAQPGKGNRSTEPEHQLK